GWRGRRRVNRRLRRPGASRRSRSRLPVAVRPRPSGHDPPAISRHRLMNLCLMDLAELTGGRLQLAAMPPFDGVLARVERIVLSVDRIDQHDVFWQLAYRPGDVESAFLRGAFG